MARKLLPASALALSGMLIVGACSAENADQTPRLAGHANAFGCHGQIYAGQGNTVHVTASEGELAPRTAAVRAIVIRMLDVAHPVDISRQAQLQDGGYQATFPPIPDNTRVSISAELAGAGAAPIACNTVPSGAESRNLGQLVP